MVMNERASPVLADNSFFDKPRASLSFVSSAGAENALREAGGTLTERQQANLDNPLAGKDIYLTSIIRSILGAHLVKNGDAAESTN